MGIRGAFALALAVLAGPSNARAQRTLPASPVKSGTLWFDGKSTLGDFKGTTKSVTGEMTGGHLTEVKGWVEALVTTLKTENDRRDRDLNKSMESAKYPTIRFDLDAVRSEWERGDSAGVALDGRFTIHGVTRKAVVSALVHFTEGGASVSGQLPMNLKDYQIGGLSKFLGVLKMNPDIVVHLDLRF